MKKMMKCAAILIITSLAASGQASKDTLYLKNGSVVYGRIAAKTKAEYKIQTNDGYLFSFAADEVDRYIPALKAETADIHERQISGFSFIMESGIPVGGSRNGFPIHFSITPAIDYSFNLLHAISVGTGLEYWDKLKLPLFVEYRLGLSENNVAPFLNFRFGGLINLEADIDDMYYKSDHKGGWTFAAGLGFMWPLGSIESFVKFGYRYAHTRDITTYPQSTTPYDVIDDKMNFNCIEMKWGFKF